MVYHLLGKYICGLSNLQSWLQPIWTPVGGCVWVFHMLLRLLVVKGLYCGNLISSDLYPSISTKQKGIDLPRTHLYFFFYFFLTNKAISLKPRLCFFIVLSKSVVTTTTNSTKHICRHSLWDFSPFLCVLLHILVKLRNQLVWRAHLPKTNAFQ